MPWYNGNDLIVHLKELKINELKNWCSKYNIKKSSNGNTNKLIIRRNIFEYEMKRPTTLDENYLLIS